MANGTHSHYATWLKRELHGKDVAYMWCNHGNRQLTMCFLASVEKHHLKNIGRYRA